MTAEAIRRIRASLNLTQTEFALLLGVHPQTVSQWERDIRVPPPYKVSLLRVFARADVEDLHHLIATQGEIAALCAVLRSGIGTRLPRR